MEEAYIGNLERLKVVQSSFKEVTGITSTLATATSMPLLFVATFGAYREL